MTDSIKKEDLKEIFTESLEPFAKAVKKDFDRMDGRFNKVDDRLTNVENKLTNVENRLTNVEIKIVNLEVDMKEVKSDVKETKNTIDKLFNRIDSFLAILERLDQGFAAMKADINRIKEAIKEKLGVDLF